MKPKAEAAQPAAKETGTDLAVLEKQELARLMAEDAGAGNTGFEDASSEAFAIPFLQILQSGSPQCKRAEGEYVPGAEEGMFFNTVTQELYPGFDLPAVGDKPAVKGGVILVPCHYAQRFIQWKLRDEGGGFVSEHLPTDPIVQTTNKDEENRDRLPNGNVLVDTRNHYVLLVTPAGLVVPLVVSMSSTQLKKSRNWMSKMNGLKEKVGSKFVTRPMASHQYLATTIPEKNDKGTWMGWKLAIAGEVTDPAIYHEARGFRDAIMKGKAKAVPPSGAEPETGTGNGSEQF